MFAGTLEEMLTAELDDHLGYDKHEPVEEKLLSMYAKGQSQRDISATIQGISLVKDGQSLQKTLKLSTRQ